jgi:hypothetical protein
VEYPFGRLIFLIVKFEKQMKHLGNINDDDSVPASLQSGFRYSRNSNRTTSFSSNLPEHHAVSHDFYSINMFTNIYVFWCILWVKDWDIVYNQCRHTRVPGACLPQRRRTSSSSWHQIKAQSLRAASKWASTSHHKEETQHWWEISSPSVASWSHRLM